MEASEQPSEVNSEANEPERDALPDGESAAPHGPPHRMNVKKPRSEGRGLTCK
jgi:hypothetical protein